MLTINFKNGDHEILWTATPKQEELMSVYRQLLKRAKAEEQAARYRRDPDKYRSLSSVASLLEEGIYSPYLGTIGGGDTFILHRLDATKHEYAVQYQYLDAQPIWLTDALGITTNGVYKVTPTGLGYIVHYTIDITDYDSW